MSIIKTFTRYEGLSKYNFYFDTLTYTDILKCVPFIVFTFKYKLVNTKLRSQYIGVPVLMPGEAPH